VEKQQGGGILSGQTNCKVLRLGYKRGRLSIRRGDSFGSQKDEVLLEKKLKERDINSEDIVTKHCL